MILRINLKDFENGEIGFAISINYMQNFLTQTNKSRRELGFTWRFSAT